MEIKNGDKVTIKNSPLKDSECTVIGVANNRAILIHDSTGNQFVQDLSNLELKDLIKATEGSEVVDAKWAPNSELLDILDDEWKDLLDSTESTIDNGISEDDSENNDPFSLDNF